MSPTVPEDRPPLTFEPENHIYRLGDRVLPGITSILVGAGLIDNSRFTPEARDRGTAVHLATQYHDEGDLAKDSLTDEIEVRLRAWNAFKKDTGFEMTESPELVVASPSLGYATAIDRIGFVSGNTFVLNIKTGAAYNWHPIQTAGEVLAYAEWRGLTGRETAALMRACVELKADGTYRLHPHTNRADFTAFRAAVTIYHLKESWR